MFKIILEEVGGIFFKRQNNPKPEKALKKKKTPFLTNEKHLLWR